jgi:hypothetical protein
MGVEGRTDETVGVEDPVSYFLEDITYHGRTERTRDAYERVLRRCERFLRERRGVGLREAALPSLPLG